MKKLVLLFAATAFFTACKKDPGSTSGNVYYKYNDYVGNKPDAGAEIKLYNLNKGAEPATYEATTDVQGNYKIENIVPGDYLLFTVSKATTASNAEILDQFVANSKDLKELFGGDIESLSKDADELKSLEENKAQAYAKAMSDFTVGDKYINEYGKYLKESTAKQDAIGKKLPAKLKLFYSAAVGYDQKIEIKRINVEEAKNVQTNTDFGITYSSK
ncbi:hypothetical protein GR160_11200 [Flavobacterium sp. Sd200]|uniref:carboxypeptidase-like regulatory domain-containing protein n=1 Tax=Flavobacterium sp. Sd200 TaxID=2692211 RepID=UPI00136859EE|nr:carboxypeptidase-like regulatory domain-containing protein [Flavobacterium sp. Sd200]MXN91792.1 hypothetical protein [Flavobacterium sp. Sd200]